LGGTGFRRLAAVSFVAAAAVIVGAAPAGAEVKGNCQASIAGQDVAPLSSSNPDDAIKVDYNDVITATASTNRPVGKYNIDLEIFGVRRPVARGSSDTNSWTRRVKVSTYANKVKSGGLIKVIGSGGGCTGAALLSVDYKGKAAITTPLGLGGAALTAVGALGLLGTAMSAARKR
jgi:hypothetical protein